MAGKSQPSLTEQIRETIKCSAKSDRQSQVGTVRKSYVNAIFSNAILGFLNAVFIGILASC
jgi:hypothetical protein